MLKHKPLLVTWTVFRILFVGFFLLIVAAILPLCYETDNATATTDVPEEATITFNNTKSTLTVPAVLASPGGTFVSSGEEQKASFSISTNNHTGYTLAISFSNNATTLTNGNYAIRSIDAITTATDFGANNSAGEAFNNQFGYLPSYYNSVLNNNFIPVPAMLGVTSDILNITGSRNSADGQSEADEYTIGIGTRVSYGIPSGTYTGSIVLQCVANPVPYYITYNENAGDDTVTNMPFSENQNVQSDVVPSDNTISISDTVPLRNSYEFNGWCDHTTISSGNNAICPEGSTLYQPGDDYLVSPLHENRLELYATWERSPYRIIYDGNGATDGSMTGTKTNIEDAETEAMLATPNFTRNGYGFVGWSLDSSATANDERYIIYGPNQTLTVSQVQDMVSNHLNASTREITVYAIWQPAEKDGNDNPIYMQDWLGCDVLGVGDTVALTDSRDNKVYTVTKFEDNRCWTTENLRLALTSNLLTTQNTNNPKVSNLNAPSARTFSGEQSGAPLYVSDANSSGNGHYYNWYATTAGNVSTTKYIGTTEGDICPNGWHLPSGGDIGNFSNLSSAIGGLGSTMSGSTSPTGENMSKLLRTYPYNFILSGSRDQSDPQKSTGVGVIGSYWSSDSTGSSGAYAMDIAETSNGKRVEPGNIIYYKYTGRTVRCVTGSNYKVTFSSNVGNNVVVNGSVSAQYIEKDKNTPLRKNEFERPELLDDGNSRKFWYDFAYWNTSSEGNGTEYEDRQRVLNIASVGQTIQLFATWQQKGVVEVVFDGNGLSFSDDVNENITENSVYYYKKGVGDQGSYFHKGGSYILPVYDEENIELLGWSYESGGNNSIDIDLVEENIRQGIESHFQPDNDDTVRLYAVWRNLFTVKFDGNGADGVSTMPPQKILEGGTESLRQNTYSKDGYVFTGWYTNANGTGNYYEDQALYDAPSSVGLGDEITLYAKWERKYTIDFNDNIGNIVFSKDLYYGQTLQRINDSSVTRPGYILAGWNSKADGSGVSFNKSSEIVFNDNMVGLDKDEYGYEDFTITLFAQWEKGYTVSYIGGDGSTPQSNRLHDDVLASSELYSEIVLPTGIYVHNSKAFDGWCLDITNGCEHLPASTTIHSQAVGNWEEDRQVQWSYLDNNNEKTITLTLDNDYNIVLYARWASIYHLEYYRNAESSVDNMPGKQSQKATNDTHVFVISELTPVRSGFIFRGWATSSDGVAEYQPGDSIELSINNLTQRLYAVWAEDTRHDYVLSYDANGGESAPAPQNIIESEETSVELSISENIPTKTGFDFLGWATTADAETAGYQPGGNITLHSDNPTVTLYALWQEKENHIVVRFIVDYARFDNYETENEVHYYIDGDTAVTIFGEYKAPIPTAHQLFMSWTTTEDGTNSPSYLDENSIKAALSEGMGELVLYAQWQKQFRIVFEPNGSNHSTEYQYVLTENTTVKLMKNTFSRPGYIFSGWNTDPEGRDGGPYQDEDDFNVSTFEIGASKVLYAQWRPIFNINYVGNGAISGYTESQLKIPIDDDSITLRANGYTRPGYDFVGWGDKQDGTGTLYGAGDSFTAPANIDAGTNITLYAQWQEKGHATVAFVSNNISHAWFRSSNSSNEVHYYKENDTVYTISGAYQTPNTASFKTFRSWNTEPDGSGTTYDTEDAIKSIVINNNETITLYAQLVDRYTIYYDSSSADRGNIEEPHYVDADGTQVVHSGAGLYKTNHTFLGWGTTNNQSQPTYAIGAEISGSAVRELDLAESGNSDPDYIIYLYAVWGEMYHVVFDKNNSSATGSMNMIDVYIGQTLENQNTTSSFEESGAAVMYWNTSPDGSGTSIPAANSLTITAQSNGTILWSWTDGGVQTQVSTPTTLNNVSVLLYAIWGSTYTLQYDANGGSNAPVSQTFIVDDNIYRGATISSQTPSRDGYTFIGWATTSDAMAVDYLSGGTINLTTPTTTLYAVWSATYTLQYDANGGSNDIVTGLPENSTYVGTDSSHEFTVSNTIPVRNGYRFIGWTRYQDNDITGYSDIYSGNSTLSTSSDVTLYAKWAVTDSNIIYDANLGSFGASNQNSIGYNDITFDDSEAVFRGRGGSYYGGFIPAGIAYSMTSNIAKYYFEHRIDPILVMVGIDNDDVEQLMTNIMVYSGPYKSNMLELDAVVIDSNDDDVIAAGHIDYGIVYYMGENEEGALVGLVEGNYSTAADLYDIMENHQELGLESSAFVNPFMRTNSSATIAITLGVTSGNIPEGLGYFLYAIGEAGNGDYAPAKHVAGDSPINFIADSITGTYSTPTRAGYDFVGWSTSQDATEAECFNEQDIINYIYAQNTNSLTVYAVWAETE